MGVDVDMHGYICMLPECARICRKGRVVNRKVQDETRDAGVDVDVDEGENEGKDGDDEDDKGEGVRERVLKMDH